MAKQSDMEVQVAEDALRQRFTHQLVLRMFVGGYHQAPDDMFVQSVDALLGTFRTESLSALNAVINKLPGNAVDTERMRIIQRDAMEEFITKCRSNFVALRNAAKEPGEAKL